MQGVGKQLKLFTDFKLGKKKKVQAQETLLGCLQ
jgi:hypothetical protein